MGIIEKDGVEILQGRAKDVTARSYALYQTNRLARQHVEDRARLRLQFLS
jgi:hypothetical protein